MHPSSWNLSSPFLNMVKLLAFTSQSQGFLTSFLSLLAMFEMSGGEKKSVASGQSRRKDLGPLQPLPLDLQHSISQGSLLLLNHGEHLHPPWRCYENRSRPWGALKHKAKYTRAKYYQLHPSQGWSQSRKGVNPFLDKTA